MSKSAYEALEIWEKTFASVYLQEFNATEAFQTAKPNTKRTSAGVEGHKLLKTPKMQQSLKELMHKRMQRLELKQDEVLRQVLDLVDFDPADMFEENGSVKDISAIPKHVRKAIVAVEVVETFTGKGPTRQWTGYVKRIRFAERRKAIELLGKHLGMWLERHDFTSGGAPLEFGVGGMDLLQLLKTDELKAMRILKDELNVRSQEIHQQPQLAHSNGGNGNGGK